MIIIKSDITNIKTNGGPLSVCLAVLCVSTMMYVMSIILTINIDISFICASFQEYLIRYSNNLLTCNRQLYLKMRVLRSEKNRVLEQVFMGPYE